jgi:hypothetical protein
VKATLLYTLARVGVFVVLFAALRLTHLNVYVAAAVSALLALLISYIFFGRLRKGVAESIVRRRAAPERDEDADLEDSVIDGTVVDGTVVDGTVVSDAVSGGTVLNGAVVDGPVAESTPTAPRPQRRRAPAEED